MVGISQNKVELFLNSQTRNSVVNNISHSKEVSETSRQQDTPSTELGKIYINPDEARKTNNLKIIGLSIAGATLLTAGGIFFFLKGGPKGLSKGFKNLSNYLENKILNSKLNTGAESNSVLLYLQKITKFASEHAEAMNNFTSFKDMLFTRIMGVTKLTEKIHQGITRFFEKVGRKTVLASYENTSSKFESLIRYSKNISTKILEKNSDEVVEINGLKMTKAKWVEEIRKLDELIKKDFRENFSEKALTNRGSRMKDIAQSLYDKFKNMKIFLSKDTFTKFIADSKIAESKTNLQNTVKGFRKGYSYNLGDMASDSNAIILDVVRMLGLKDSKNIIIKLGTIRGNIQKYINNCPNQEVVKILIKDDISLVKNEIIMLAQNEKLKNSKEILAKLDDLLNVFDNFEEGKVEKILKIYKKLLPKEEYEKVKTSYKSAVNSLDNSIKIETEDYFNKLRDLTLGSAPTDILTILGSFGVLGYELGKSKDKNQRESIALKYGIPALAGVGVSLYCNAKLYAGSKSLIVGAASTWLLNRIGEYSDKKLKQYKVRSNKQ